MLKTNVKRQSILAAIGTTVLAIGEERTIAQAACTGLGSEKRYTAAIPRARWGKSYQDIYSSITWTMIMNFPEREYSTYKNIIQKCTFNCSKEKIYYTHLF